MAVEPMRFVYHEIFLDGKQSVHANVAMVKKKNSIISSTLLLF